MFQAQKDQIKILEDFLDAVTDMLKMQEEHEANLDDIAKSAITPVRRKSLSPFRKRQPIVSPPGKKDKDA